MYADDLFLYTRGRVIESARDKLSGALGLVIPWLQSLGCEISIGKCQFSVFSRTRFDIEGLVMSVEGHDLPCCSGIKYLSVILDRRLTWASHVHMIADRAIRSINVIRISSRVSWGVTPSMLLFAYRGLVRSTLEWGSLLFSSACGGTLRLLDRAQYMALRAVLGCMQSTPVSIHFSESGEPPLGLRRNLLNYRFLIRNFSWRCNPLIPKLVLLSERVGAVRRFRSLRSALVGSYLGLVELLGMISRTVRPGCFDWPWRTVTLPIEVELEMGSVFKSSANSGRACVEFLNQQYAEFDVIYTDGSVDPVSGNAGCGFNAERDDFRFGLALQSFTSVLSAELYTIFRAIHYSSRAGMNRVLVVSDSWAALSALRDCFAAPVSNYLVFKIAHMLKDLRDMCRVVGFMWVPGHVG